MRRPMRSRRWCASMEEPCDEAGRYGPVLRFRFFLVGPFELRQCGSGDAARLEPFVAVRLTAGAVGPSALLRDIERTGRIHGWLASMGLTHADELDEGSIHLLKSLTVATSGGRATLRSGRRDSDPRPFG